MRGIKPENVYGKTYGKTTLDISSNQYVVGQDFVAKDKYVSSNSINMMPPSERLQRTAADIVGVANTKIPVNEVISSRFSRP